jgi:hypothetical protein
MTSKRQNRSDSERPTASLPPDYSALLIDVKNRIRTAQIRASLSVNRELIQLYWDIGHLIVERQRAQGWGRSVVERLAADIRKSFPGMAGFSPQNIWKMRGFFLAWTAEVRNLSQAVRESRRAKFLSQLAREIDGEHLLQGCPLNRSGQLGAVASLSLPGCIFHTWSWTEFHRAPQELGRNVAALRLPPRTRQAGSAN